MVEPYRLVHTGSRWYLHAFDLERDAWLTIRVDRIGSRPRPGHSFAPRPLPSDEVAAYVGRTVSATSRQYSADVTLHARAKSVA